MVTIKSLILVLVLTSFAGAANIWQQVSSPSGAQQIRDFTIIPSNNHWFLADRQSGFWRSTDQGNTWTQINNSGIALTGWTIEYDSFHGQLIAGTYPGSGVGFWRSSNEGASWTPIPVSFSLSLNPTFTGPLVDPNTGLIAFGGRDGSISNCGSWYSTDGGVTTNIISASPGCFGSWSWLYNPITKDYWFGTEASGTYRGADGKNFAQVFPDPPGPGNAEALSYDSSGNIIVGGRVSGQSNNGFWRSSGSNGSYTFTQILHTIGSPRSLFRDPNGFLYFGQSDTFGQVTPPDTNAVYRSTDQGNSWSAWTSGIGLSSNSSNLEAWHFVYNSNDGKLYINAQDGATNNGFVYVTVQPITGITAGLQPPSNLQIYVH